jgi:hypothetical protein
VRVTAPAPAAAPPPAVRPRRSTRRTVLTAVLVVWGLVLAGLAVWSYRHDEPTVREQRTLAQAAPVVERTVGDLVAAAGPAAVPVVAGSAIAPGCRITPLRRGSTLTVALRFYAAADGGPALLRRLADGLPDSYRAAASDRALRVDAGSFVGARGRLSEPGVVQVNVTTGCRPGTLTSPVLAPAARLDDVPVRVLSALGVAAVDPVTTLSAPCPGGGAVTTARATGRGVAPPLATTLGGAPVLATPEVYAYRDGPYAYAVTVDGDAVAVFATSGC